MANIAAHFHFGVYGAAFSDDGARILAIIKTRGAYAGRYDLPGGTVDIPETLEDTLRREIKEETGCDVISCAQQETIATAFYYDEAGQPSLLYHVWLIYGAKVAGDPLPHGDGRDSDGALWLPIAEITEDNAAPGLWRVARAMLKA